MTSSKLEAYVIRAHGTPFARVEVFRHGPSEPLATSPPRKPPTFLERLKARLVLLETAVWIWWDLLKQKLST